MNDEAVATYDKDYWAAVHEKNDSEVRKFREDHEKYKSKMRPYERFYYDMTPQARGRYERERETLLANQHPPCKAIVTLIRRDGATRKVNVPFFGPPEVGFSNMDSHELRDWWTRHCKRHGILGKTKKENMLLVEINAGDCKLEGTS